MNKKNNLEARPDAGEWRAPKSVKQLKTTQAVSEYQKAWFKQIQERAKTEPVGICDAGEVEEIFTVMDIPVITKQWWSGAIAAKQLSAYYFNLLEQNGYDKCRYCALGLACTMDHDSERAPWGGLPKPTVIVGGQIPGCECDISNRITQLWAREYNAISFPLEVTYPTRLYPRWWETITDHWNQIIEPRRIDLRVEEFKELIRLLEIITGKTFSLYRLKEVMELVNEQNEYFKKAHDLIAETVPCPVSLTEQVSIYRTQWHRGTQAGLDLTRMFYQEVKERVENGEAAHPGEKLRLMWLGVGLWHNVAFYRYFEEKYGAVFTCSLYLGVAADGYRRNLFNDPLRALAGRSVFLGLGSSEWQIKEAKVNQVDGVVQLVSKNCREFINAPLIRVAFENAGIPVLPVYADNVDVREWDDAKVKSQVSSFIETRLSGKR